nr:MAG TPA: hypothetical protein [Siphoviridae sp. ctJsG2]
MNWSIKNMKDKRKKANNVINRPKRYVKGTQKW